VVEALDAFRGQFETDDNQFPFIHNGLFGYMAYDAVQHFEDIRLRRRETRKTASPKSFTRCSST
jgi:anthranilate synthase component 1